MSDTDRETTDDPGEELVIVAFRELAEAMRRNRERNEEVIARVDEVCRRRLAGETWRQIVEHEDRPLIVELLGRNIDELYAAGGRVRRLEARALHDEGLSMEQIARLFGVTRQRVSALLRDERSN